MIQRHYLFYVEYLFFTDILTGYLKAFKIKNGISNYMGRPTENIKLLSLLKSGRLLK